MFHLNIHLKHTGTLSRGLDIFRTSQCCLNDGTCRSYLGVKDKGFGFVRRQGQSNSASSLNVLSGSFIICCPGFIIWTRGRCWIWQLISEHIQNLSLLSIFFAQLFFCFPEVGSQWWCWVQPVLSRHTGQGCRVRPRALGREWRELGGPSFFSPSRLAVWSSCMNWTAQGLGWISRQLLQMCSEPGTENSGVPILREEAVGMPPYREASHLSRVCLPPPVSSWCSGWSTCMLSAGGMGKFSLSGHLLSPADWCTHRRQTGFPEGAKTRLGV